MVKLLIYFFYFLPYEISQLAFINTQLYQADFVFEIEKKKVIPKNREHFIEISQNKNFKRDILELCLGY